jgi:uncharacterized protein HemX
MLLLLAAPGVSDGATETVVKAIVSQGILGALLLLAVALCAWAVVKLNKVQSDRVKDQKEMSDKLEKAQNLSGELVKDMTRAFGKNSTALDRLAQTETEQSRRLDSLSGKVERMDRNVELAVRSRAQRSYTPTSVKPQPPRRER